MELEPPSQRDSLACRTPQTFGMFELGKITFGLGQSSIIFQTTACKADRKADNLTMRTENEGHPLELAPPRILTRE